MSRSIFLALAVVICLPALTAGCSQQSSPSAPAAPVRPAPSSATLTPQQQQRAAMIQGLRKTAQMRGRMQHPEQH